MRTKRGKETSLLECLLKNLKVASTNEVNDWYRRYYDNNYRLDGMDEAKDLIDKFKDKEIHIIGDYDVDGVTATSIMYLGLKAYGCSKVFFRTPHRFSEGFGLKKTMVEEITEDDCLIITVDNGVAALEAVEYAKSRGMTVIVTDHHLPVTVDEEEIGFVPVLPEADLIIDPNAIDGSADYTGYCGAGIAYKLMRHLLGETARQYECIAAIGTIADVMELREENFVIVKRGLEQLIKTNNIGLRALLERLQKTEHVSAMDVGFTIGPCINAPGRLIDDGSMRSVELLITDNKEEAKRLANFLVDQNYTRKQQVDLATKNIIKDIEKNKMTEDIPIIAYIPKINEGIVGIVAARVEEKYQRPAIILTDSENKDIFKGSARAPEGFNIKACLDRCADEIYVYGGHEGAAGLSIEGRKLKRFREACQESAKAEGYKPSSNADISYDFEVNMADIPEAIDLIEKFEPHGEGNPTLIIKVPDFVNIPKNSLYKTMVGTEGIKFFGENLTAVNFHAAKDFADYEKPEKMILYGELSYNYYKGNKTPQINFIDFEVVSSISDAGNQTPFADLLSVMASMRE